MSQRIRRGVAHGLARAPSLFFLVLTFAATVYIVSQRLPGLLLAPFVVLTLVVLVVMVWDTFSNRHVLEQALSQRITIDGITAPRLRDHVQRAVEYRSELRAVLLNRDSSSSDLSTVEEAAVFVERLCRTIDRYEKDRLLIRDTERLESAQTLSPAEEDQLRTLVQLRQQMKQAEDQAIELLATLGESYASVRHLESISETDGTAPLVLDRLRTRSIRLRETVLALEELYEDSLATNPRRERA
ncbi:MAG TPA: hypothetical protein VMP10_03960 [Chloroflexota bacterium]|nr:hypothetical protein [Chloroflexota bacterium]